MLALWHVIVAAADTHTPVLLRICSVAAYGMSSIEICHKSLVNPAKSQVVANVELLYTDCVVEGVTSGLINVDMLIQGYRRVTFPERRRLSCLAIWMCSYTCIPGYASNSWCCSVTRTWFVAASCSVIRVLAPLYHTHRALAIGVCRDGVIT
jgi:hypothetical protein